jgi:hypothetical protein
VHTVLGLSLTSDDVAWVLWDPAGGTVVDHDVLALDGDADIAGAFARSAHALARACGFDVDHVRLTWTREAARDGLRLRTQLGSLGFSEVEVVPMACAAAVSVDPETTGVTARLALAYGAALAVPQADEAITAPVIPQRSRLPRGRIALSLLGAAAAAALGVLSLSTGATTQFQSPTTAAEEVGAPNPGWATVPAPSEVSAVRKVVATPSEVPAVRKVVTTPSHAQQSWSPPAQSYVPVGANVPTGSNVPTGATVPAGADRAVAPEVAQTPAQLPHLSGVQHAMGPIPGPAEALTASSVPDKTESVPHITESSPHHLPPT